MSKAEERIDRLQKRADHLRGRVAAAEADGRDLTFDKAELSALLWAIPLLRSGEAVQLEELAQMCDEIGASDYQKIKATHGERLAWCHGAVACADAIRAKKRSFDTEESK